MPWALDEAQREAVEAPDRAVLVVAGPGTGKTRVLTARAAYLTEEEGVDPARILAITYTNRAAAEMRSRLAAHGQGEGEEGEEGGAGSPASEVTVLTFHAWAYRMVRKHADALGFPHEPIVFDEEATEQLLRRLLGLKRIPEEVLPIRHLKQLLDRAKAHVACPLWDERVDPDHWEETADLLRSYQEALEHRGALDFADILLVALRLLYCYPDIRGEITQSIDHLLIDEFQDINPAQYTLVEALAHPGLYLFAVGDEDQTIYAFRGSSGEFMDRFVADYSARLVPLGKSYRCSSGLLYAAGALIGRNRRSYLRPPRPPDDIKERPPISVFEVEDEEEEARLVTKLVRSWAESGCSYRDMAVLYRVHNLADECERVLLEKGVPTLRLLPERQREELPGDPLPLLRLAAADNEWDWDRALGLPRDRLGELDDLRVRIGAMREGVAVSQLLGRPTRFKHLSLLARAQLGKLHRFVRTLQKRAAEEAPSMLVNLVAEHLATARSPWLPHEDAWLAEEEESLSGFDRLSPEALLEEWHGSEGGIRIFHAPTITALIAARILERACAEMIGVKVETVPLPFSIEEAGDFPRDSRPACVIGLTCEAGALFPSGTLLPRALYISPEGVSDSLPERPTQEECFSLALTAHRLVATLVGYRPGGAPGEELVFFDLETTGTDIFRSEIVECAAIRVHLKGGEARELGHFHSLVKPSGAIPAAATAVHGITDADVADAPKLADVLPRFLEFLGDAPLAGHNIDHFDLPILRRHAGALLGEAITNLSLDTLPLSRRLFPGEPHRLGALAEKLGVAVGEEHRALDDVRANIGVFSRLIAIDERARASGVPAEIAPALAVAHGVDETAETDPTHLRAAASRLLGRYSGEIEDQPFVKSLLKSLSPTAGKGVIGIVRGLARMHLEEDDTEAALRARTEFLRAEALRLEDDRPDVTLGEHLAHIALLTDVDFESDEDAVRLMTLHAAKGLEFDRVVIIGLEQGNLPHRFAMNKTIAEIEEERRLCYVGLTRARRRAALVYARRRYGRWRPLSMFLGELPARACRRYRTKDRITGET